MAYGGAGSSLSLSDLSDDLLRHILSFAPQRETAVTAVLSRRWLTLWRTSGDVYLDSRSFNGGCSSPVQESEAFLRGAEKALAVAAAHGDIRRLTFSIAEDSKLDSWSVENLIDALVSNPASWRVEELKIEVKPLNCRCTVNFGSLPSEALRQLRLINCSKLTTPPLELGAAAFQKLVELHLEHCSVSLVDFQTIIDAAPQLSTLHLKSSCVCIENTTDDYDDMEDLVGRLFIPAVTDLVLEDCVYGYDEDRIELDAPRLQYFRYRGHVQQTNKLSLMPQASSNMIQVDLHLTYDIHCYNATPTRNLFWQFIQNFTTTKLLKLKLDNFVTMDDIALKDKASRDELLGGLSFDLLEQLELEAEYNYKPGFKISMVMLANLLHCCPMVRDLRLRLSKHHQMPWMSKHHQMPWITASTDKEARLHFNKSVNGFRNRRRKSMVSLGGHNNVNYDAFDIPGFTGECSFSCLQNHLQRVSLQFFMDELNCIEVQLAKFFTQNAMVLQEMHIDDGSQEMLEHVNSGLRTGITNTRIRNSKLNVKD